MSFSDDFAGPTGQLLSARPGWSFGFGDDTLAVNASGQLAKTATGTAALSVWYRTDDQATDQRAALAYLQTINVGQFVMGSGNASTFSAYQLRIESARNAVRVYRWNAGVREGSVITGLNITGLGNADNLELRAQVISPTRTDLYIYQNGSVIAGPVSDTSANVKTAGRRGLLINTTAAANPAFDGYSDNYAVATTAPSIAEVPFAGYTFEGVRGAPSIVFDGARSAGAVIERRVRCGATVVLDWGTTGVSYPSPTSWRWVNTTLPARTDGVDYTLEVRDAAEPATLTTAANSWAVGAVVPINDQSIHEIMALGGKPNVPGAFTAVTANNVRVMYAVDRTGTTRAVNGSRLNVPAAYGSGYVAMADQIGRDVAAGDLPNIPIMLVDIAKEGQPMTTWISNDTPNGWAWTLQQYADFMFAACGRRITALIRPVVVTSGGMSAISAWLGYYDQLISIFDAMMTSQPQGSPYPIWVPGCLRTSRTWVGSFDNYLLARAVSREAGNRGGRYKKMLSAPLDIEMQGGFQLHQADGRPTSENNDAAGHRAGNIRLGLRYGRGVAALMQAELAQPVTLDTVGPRIIKRQFTSTGKTAIRLTFDRDVETPSGATTQLPGHWFGTGNTFASPVHAYGVQTSARTIEVAHPSGGNWTGVDLRYDYLRDSPFPAAYQGTDHGWGTELDISQHLDKLMYDTSVFEDGRGFLTQAGEADYGYVVEEASAQSYTTILKGGTVTLTKAQAATLRVKDGGTREAGVGAEPIGIRWERKSGDLTGRPYDGINVPLTVA